MSHEPFTPSTPPVEADPFDRLDSWKDIASYLRRDVSTVQRWEKREAMPVHRHVHEKLGSVYAFRSELDAWSRGRGVAVSVAAGESAEGALLVEAPPPARVRGELRAHGGRRSRVARWLQDGLEASSHPTYVIAAIAVLALLAVLAVLVTLALDVGVRRPASVTGERGIVQASRHDSAQELLLRAKYLGVRTTDADTRHAIALIDRAIAIEPSSARAHAALASAYVTRLAYVSPSNPDSPDVPDESMALEERAFAAAERALALDPNAPEAYVARGDLLWTHAQRFAHDRAIREFRRALTLAPESASDEIHRRLARVYVHVGFFDEALRHADRALAINPSNAQALNSRAQALLWMGKDDDALSILRSIPGPVLPELVEANTAFALMRLGRYADAWTTLREAQRKYPDDANGTLRGIEAMLQADANPQAARILIASIASSTSTAGRTASNPSHHAAYFVACALARMRRADEAVRWLTESAATGFPCYPLFARDPNLDPIRDDPRFHAFITDLQKRSASLRHDLFR